MVGYPGILRIPYHHIFLIGVYKVELTAWQSIVVYGAMVIILILLVGLALTVGSQRTPEKSDNSDRIYPVEQHPSSVNQNRKNTL